MSVSPVMPIVLAPSTQIEGSSTMSAPDGPSFGRWLDQGLVNLGESLERADAGARAVAAGENAPVHEVMLAMEQARLKLQLAVEVRNRVVEAYQNLTNMQL
jgi:flagellar hook-basal body complex protein FliE